MNVEADFIKEALDLKALIENSGADVVEMDFHGVKFAEWYKTYYR